MQLDSESTCTRCGRRFIAPTTLRGTRRRTCSRRCASMGPRRRVPLDERFWRHVLRTETCWLWTGVHTPNGAGIVPVRDNGNVRRLTAARLAWELFVGPMPPGRRIWRRCRRPACVRPEHLVLVRRGHFGQITQVAPGAVLGHAANRSDARRIWWTRERVLAGLVAFHRATGLVPTTGLGWSALIRGEDDQPRYPTAYAVMRHFPNFRAAWNAAGIQQAHARWARWTAEDDTYLITHLGVVPTALLANTLRRGEPAIRARAGKLGLSVSDARGWPIHRVARITGLSEFVVRRYIGRGALPALKGAKVVYVDPADVVVVSEIDWQHPPSELEAAALRSLRQRLLAVLRARARSQPGHGLRCSWRIKSACGWG